MDENTNYIIDVLMQVDKANQVIIESMEQYPSCDKEKVEEAKDLLDKAYKLLLQSLV